MPIAQRREALKGCGSRLRLDAREYAQYRANAWFSSDRTVGEYAQDIWKVPFELPPIREQAKRRR